MSTILIIDDVATDRQLMGLVVSAIGHQPIYAADGEEGLSKAKDLHPEMILLDVVMPKLDGFATCRKLKKDAATEKIPVVLVTSKGGESDKAWGERQGAVGHVVKPFTPDDLKSAITRILSA